MTRGVLRAQCPACGSVLIDIPIAEVRSQPTTSRVLVEQAERRHQTERGCTVEAQTEILRPPHEVEAIEADMKAIEEAIRCR